MYSMVADSCVSCNILVVNIVGCVEVEKMSLVNSFIFEKHGRRAVLSYNPSSGPNRYRFKEMAMDSLSAFTYGLYRVEHDTCVTV